MTDIEALYRELIQMHATIHLSFAERDWRWVLSPVAFDLLREYAGIPKLPNEAIVDVGEMTVFGLSVRVDEHAPTLHPMLELRR